MAEDTVATARALLPDFGDPDQVPADLIAAGAAALDGATWSTAEQMVRTVLSATLAGRVVLTPPKPLELDEENVGYWGDWRGGDYVTARPPNDDPGDTLHGVNLSMLIRSTGLSPAFTMRVVGWLVAAAMHSLPPQPDPRAEPADASHQAVEVQKGHSSA